MEYRKTRDILCVMQVFDHKDIKKTLTYTQLTASNTTTTSAKLPKQSRKEQNLWKLDSSSSAKSKTAYY
jgi:hypothetical protein